MIYMVPVYSKTRAFGAIKIVDIINFFVYCNITIYEVDRFVRML